MSTCTEAEGSNICTAGTQGTAEGNPEGTGGSEGRPWHQPGKKITGPTLKFKI